MVYENLKKISFLIVQSVVVAVSAAYYQKEYSGYLFTTFSLYTSEWRYQSYAQDGCTQNGSKLLAITNASIQDAAVAFINDAIRQNQLTGNNIITDGKRAGDNWKWINGAYAYPLGVSFTGRDSGFSLSYVYLYKETSALYAAQPTETNYYICEFAGQTSCVNGYQNQNQCFKSVNDESVTWFEARNRCLMRGGDLATFEFITTNDGLNSLNGSWINPKTKYWIGLRRQWWTWQNIKSDVTYSQWSDGHPYDLYQDCLCLVPNRPVYDWKWSECYCSSTYQFVCIRASSSTVSTAGPTSVTTTATPLTSINQSSPSSNNLTNHMPHSSTVAIQNGTNVLSSISDKDNNLAIGLGVGLGGGVLLIIILIIAAILLSRKGYISFPRKSKTPKDASSSSPPDFSSSQPPMDTVYAPIVPTNQTAQDDINNPDQTPAVYAPLEIIGINSNSKHNTLAPPSTSDEINTEL